MPFLCEYGEKGTVFTNMWSTSHCTDPAITHMLSGLHPDALQLYSMMYEHKDYTIPKEVVIMLPQTAREHGYDTGFITNIGRWYKRGVNKFIDCRRWPGLRIFKTGVTIMKAMRAPWFLIVHTDDCHTNYTGGSYEAACKAVDGYIKMLVNNVPDDTAVVITADHGEGLGQKGIKQHGFGLYDFLTHVPLISKIHTHSHDGEHVGEIDYLVDPGSLYRMTKFVITGDLDFADFGLHYVFQAGDTPPNIRHRGVVDKDGNQFIRKSVGATISREHFGNIEGLEEELAKHCEKFGIDYWQDTLDPDVEERLRALGYFE